ncbi:MurR/RpiR family transcriptional regulator [Microbacterium esteraromaticum]|uniref:MurR/RpiR family transcriptional regulator n=1 Tax=Microbacterium esteraromaticum TaxID=57043 RepID=UPI003C2E7C10
MNASLGEPPLGGTIEQILSLLPSLVPSAQRVARLCAERPQDVVEMSGAELAEAAETSPATVSRASRGLGFRGFQHLRMMLLRDLAAEGAQRQECPTGTEGYLRSLAESAGTMLQTSLASVDPDAFDTAVAAIARARRVLLVGTGGSHAAAQAAAMAFTINGRPCEAPSDGVVAQLTARVLSHDDVCLVVSASGANSLSLAVADAAIEAGATVIGLSSFARPPLASRAAHMLVTGARFQSWDQGTMASGLVQLLALNALQIAVAERMVDASERARSAVREEVLDLVADDATDTDEDEDVTAEGYRR